MSFSRSPSKAAPARRGHAAPAHLEAQAHKAAHAAGPGLSAAPLSAVAGDLAATSAPLTGGRSLTPNESASLPSGLQRGAATARIHDDAEGAQAAEAVSANAFTHGSHIAFGAGAYHSGSSQGQALLAHEVAHTLQQQGGPAIVQKDEKAEAKPKAPSHLGDQPPATPFEISRARGKVSEDTHFLFEQDQADLPSGADKTLQALAAKYQGTLSFEITGYASTEGDAAYNINLAAYRAATVQAALAPYLPPGATVRLISRGETDAYGAAAENRRVGIEVIRVLHISPQAREDMLKPGRLDFGHGGGNAIGGQGPYLNLGGPPPAVDLSPRVQLKNIYSDPGLLSLQALPPTLFPEGGIDWRAMSEPLYLRGLRITSSDYAAIESHWTRTYSLLLWTGLFDPKSARSTANTLTGAMLNYFAAGEQPTLLDQAQHERDVTHTQTIPNIPITSVVEFLWGKIKGKDVDITHF